MASKYVDSDELEMHWDKWLSTNETVHWHALLDGVYKICSGVATNFKPQSDEEHIELTHEAFVLTVLKIKDGRLRSQKKAPIFNLLTTTIFRHLYSLKTRQSRHDRLLRTTYADRVAFTTGAPINRQQDRAPENDLAR